MTIQYYITETIKIHKAEHKQMTPGELERTEGVRQSPPDVMVNTTQNTNPLEKTQQIVHTNRLPTTCMLLQFSLLCNYNSTALRITYH